MLNPNAGGFDAFNITGAVLLNGANLVLIPGTGLSFGDTFLILDNDGTGDAINGTFAGKPEAGTFIEDGYAWDIAYAGGDGNDAVLIIVPEPSAAAVLRGGLTFSVLLARRRCRAWRCRRPVRQSCKVPRFASLARENDEKDVGS